MGETQQVFGCLKRQLIACYVFEFGEFRGCVDDERRFIALAAVGYGREIWCISFDQQAVHRHALSRHLQFGGALEGQDAGQRDIEAEAERMAGELFARREAVQEAGESALPHFFREDRGCVVIGFARVNDERQACLARGSDVGAEAALLRFARAVLVIIIETRFADADDFWMLGKFNEARGVGVRFGRGFMGMDADGAIDIGEAFGDGETPVEFADLRRNRHHQADARLARARDNLIDFGSEVGEIEMTMAVYKDGFHGLTLTQMFRVHLPDGGRRRSVRGAVCRVLAVSRRGLRSCGRPRPRRANQEA